MGITLNIIIYHNLVCFNIHLISIIDKNFIPSLISSLLLCHIIVLQMTPSYIIKGQDHKHNDWNDRLISHHEVHWLPLGPSCPCPIGSNSSMANMEPWWIGEGGKWWQGRTGNCWMAASGGQWAAVNIQLVGGERQQQTMFQSVRGWEATWSGGGEHSRASCGGYGECYSASWEGELCGASWAVEVSVAEHCGVSQSSSRVGRVKECCGAAAGSIVEWQRGVSQNFVGQRASWSIVGCCKVSQAIAGHQIWPWLQARSRNPNCT